jgi:hypothetical protein
LKGRGTLAIGDEEKPFKKGDLVFVRGKFLSAPKTQARVD